ncbi:nuclear receptor coactivator 6-like isoform X2 [Coccinella septempunctata]|uniref:nuclear receptor coactivator 6-like isoform X2 n=1 Tax=Coccinella septempunctata TaxID=41139 RepID=UPI001D068A70|nr:nuclear receptor coactivator 6-like isoform X2 [Coccinella septempunctata]
MAGKPELSASAGVQNVVVYVSNDNFAQAYAVGQQNVPQGNHPSIQNGIYPNPPHSMAPVVGPTKCCSQTGKPNTLKPPDYATGQVINGSEHQQQGYYTEVLSQNGFSQPIINNVNYANNAIINQVKNYNSGSSDVLSGDRQTGPGRPECDREAPYVDSSYITVIGGECPSQSVRCDSVRSDAAESSCSSSSTDEGIVMVQNPAPEMVVYDSSVSVRPGGVVLAVGPSSVQQQTASPLVGTSFHNHQSTFVTVPFGWKRLLNNGNIIYISPSNTALSSPEQIKEYLLSSGTCKCGLECHFKYDNVFNFDPKVSSKPWSFPPDTNIGDLKLCNHKRKIMSMAALECKQMDPNIKLRKDYNVKRKKRRIDMPYCGGISVSQILAQREKLGMGQQNFVKDGATNQQVNQQVWASHQQQQHQQQQMQLNNRLQAYPNNMHLPRYPGQDSNDGPHNGESSASTHQPMPPNISQQTDQVPNQHRQPSSDNPNIHVHHQHVMTPNGQIINMQKSIPPQQHAVIHSQNNMGVFQGQKPAQFMAHNHPQTQQRVYVNSQPNEPSGPGRPMQVMPVGMDSQQRPMDVQQRIGHQQFYNNQPSMYPQMPQYDPSKSVRPIIPPNNPAMNGFRPQVLNHQGQMMQQQMMMNPNHQKMQWQNRIPTPVSQSNQQQQQQMPLSNVYERVPPLHQHPGSSMMWQEEVKKKKMKLSKISKNRAFVMECQTTQSPCPNVDIRQIPGENDRGVILNQLPPASQSNPVPSFMEDPSGYLAQQTALLNNTINRQTGANPCAGYACNSPTSSVHPTHNTNIISITSSQNNEVPLPSNVMMQMKQNQSMSQKPTPHQNVDAIKSQQQSQQMQNIMQQQFGQTVTQGVPDSSAVANVNEQKQQQQQYVQCQGCIADSMNASQQYIIREQINNQGQKILQYSRPNSQPGTPSSSGGIEDVTSSTFSDKQSVQNSPDSRPIQGGTVSTSNVSPIDGLHSGPPTPNSHTPSSMTPNPNTPNTPNPHTPSPYTPNQHPVTPTPPTPTQQIQNQFQVPNIHQQQMQNQHHQQPNHPQNHPQQNPNSQPYMVQRISDSQTGQNYIVYSSSGNTNMQQIQMNPIKDGQGYSTGPPPRPEYYVNTSVHQQDMQTSRGPFISGIVTTMASGRTVGSNTITSVLAGRANTATVSINSPQSVNNPSPPSSIQGQNVIQNQPVTVNVSKSPLEMVQSVVSSIQVPQTQHTSSMSHSNAQVSPTIVKPTLPPGHILVSSGGQLIMANTGNCQTNVMPPPPPKLVANHSPMPPISASPMITNVTAAVTQMIPAVAQQMLGQQTVLVNALPTPFVLQPGVTMTMDGVTVGQNMQIPQIVTGNVLQQQVQIETNDARRGQGMLSPESKKKGKKRKLPPQTVAGMLQIAAQQNSGMVMQQQSFPQQIQMAHSPQSITGPVMQALTIVPSKNGGPAQIVMNGQANIGTQQLITNSQPTQQINLLQPVNLINGGTGVMQNFPTIQQFIVPNLGGMVMNPDGTATLLQDTSNIGMQLQLQNVNGQNILTPVQNSGVFNGSQNIIAAGPAGMVIRTPNPTQGKIIQQQHSPGAQFLSPNGGQFVVNGAQFSGQLSPLVASVSPSQQVTFSSPAQQMRSQQAPQQEYIQCNQMGQTLMVPCNPGGNISGSNSNQNTTYVQQNTTIVQQQTTMVSNNQPQQNQQNMQRTTTLNVDHNFLISSNDNKQQMHPVLIKECPQSGLRNSVSTQTATNQSQAVTTNTFCQTSTVSAGSPPDTTTHSPLALGGQSPPTVDTTTHSGSTDDGLSPAPSNCSASFNDVTIQGRHQSMAMVHCISSSEPDSADFNPQSSDNECFRTQVMTGQKHDYAEVTNDQIHYLTKKNNPTHFAYAESSTMVAGVHFVADQMKADESVVSSRHSEKRKSSDTLLVMETRQLHFEEEEAAN